MLRDFASSWWNDVAATYGGRTIVGGTMRTGQFQVAEYDRDRYLVARRVLGEPLYTQDDHNEASVHFLDNGALIVALIGHSNARTDAPAGTNGRLVVYYSATGRVADLVGPITLPSLFTGLNYGWWLEGPTRLVLFTNDDPTVSWAPFYAPGKDPNAFVQGRQVVRQASAPGGGSNQLYCRAVMAESRVSRMVFYPHPTNVQNRLRLVEMDVETGDVWASTARTVLGNAYTSGANIIGMTSAPVIYTPGTGKSVRLLDVSPDGSMIAACEFDNPNTAAATHFVLVWDGVTDRFTEAAWTRRDIGSAGVAFGNVSYFGSLVFAREAHRGIRLYRCREAGGWFFDRVESGNLGLSFQSTNLYSSSAYKLPRCFTPKNATDAFAVYLLEGLYDNFNSWRLRGRAFASGV